MSNPVLEPNTTHVVKSLWGKGLTTSVKRFVRQSAYQDTFLSDTITYLPLSVKDDTISDRVDLLPDSLSDTKNTPSDDSSYSESIAEKVLTTQSDEIEQVGGDALQNYSFAEFHHLLGIPTPTNKTKANGEIAIAIARDKGLSFS